jgi:hypothetical protein
MKKLVVLNLLVLFAAVMVSCARATGEQAQGTPRPGIKIGDMTLQEHSGNKRYPDLISYCGQYTDYKKEPTTQTIDCEVPLLDGIRIDFAWGAKDTTILDSNWSAMTWEMSIDGQQINLYEFELWNGSGRDSAGHQAQGRGWTLDLLNLSPGKHTLRLLWKSETPIDDGFDIYAPGTYENIVNFTVLEK